MTTFKLSDGQTFEVPSFKGHNGQYLAILAERQYTSGPQKGEYSLKLSEEAAAITNKKVEKPVNLRNRDTLESYTATDTYFLAENQDFKEYETVSTYYDYGFAVNARYTHKIEVTLQGEELQKRFYLEWKGNVDFYSYVSRLEDEIEEAIYSDVLRPQGIYHDKEQKRVIVWMYNDDGEFIDVDLSTREITQMIVAVRLIEFTETIIEEETT